MDLKYNIINDIIKNKKINKIIINNEIYYKAYELLTLFKIIDKNKQVRNNVSIDNKICRRNLDIYNNSNIIIENDVINDPHNTIYINKTGLYEIIFSSRNKSMYIYEIKLNILNSIVYPQYLYFIKEEKNKVETIINKINDKINRINKKIQKLNIKLNILNNKICNIKININNFDILMRQIKFD